MIKYIFVLVSLFSLCSNTLAQVVNTAATETKFSGKIEKASRTFFLIEREGKSDTVKLAKDGSFELLIKQVSPDYFLLQMGKNSMSLYLLPGDDFNAQFIGSTIPDNAVFSGKSAVYASYLAGKQRQDRDLSGKSAYNKWSEMTPAVFMATRDSIRNSRIVALEKEAKTGAFDANFVAIEKKSFNYQFANDLILYRQVAEEKYYPMPANFIDAINNTKRDDDAMAWNEQFLTFAQNMVKQEAALAYNAGVDKSYLHYYELQVNKVCELFPTEQCRNAIYPRIMQDLIKDVGTQDLTNCLRKFEECCTNKSFVQRVKTYAAQFEYMYAGRPAPDAAFYDTTGKTMRFSDYRGKLLYVDVWATWCGPCKREIPDLKKLEEEYHGKNIHFLSISTDKDLNAWKNYIRKNDMAGLQMHQSDIPEEGVSMLYMVNSIPRFLLIDEAGKIISADAPRPSSGELIRNLINSNLKD